MIAAPNANIGGAIETRVDVGLMSNTRKDDVAQALHDRVHERSRGCWNCKSFETDTLARGFWNVRRLDELGNARALAMTLEGGEDHPRIKDLRRMIDLVDQGVASCTFGICLANKAKGDLVHNAFLCDSWNGMQGVSSATAGQPVDLLPEELKDKIGD